MKKNRSVQMALMTITQFSLNMLVPIVACTFLGVMADRHLGTGFIAVVMFFVGAAAGFRNIYRMALAIVNTDPDARTPYGRVRYKDDSGVDKNE